MAAVAESCFLTDVSKIIISLQEQVFHMAYPHFSDVGTAWHSIVSVKFGGKAGIAHSCQSSKLLHPDFFRVMTADILGGGYKRLLIGIVCGNFMYSEPVFYTIWKAIRI